MKNFTERVHDIVSQIPRGKVMTYRQIARKLKVPKASRAVGNAVGCNRDFKKVPCYRVVRSDGSIGGYSRKGVSKRKLLENDGIRIKNNRITNLESYLYR